MTATTIRVQMAQRKDTAANWTAANPILLSGEIGYETDTKKFKIGNGSTNWNSLAYLPIPDGSGNLTITGNLEIGTTGSLTFEGSTADGFETTLAVINPTADRTITLPNQSGTVLVSGNASIVDEDIAANAEIAVSKLADGAARQLIQTDAAGTGVEWTSNIDVPGTLDVTSTATFDSIAQYPAGSAAAPTITFTGDTNTGLFSPGSDQLALATGGTGRLFVDASGNIAAGTSATSNFGATARSFDINSAGGVANLYVKTGTVNGGLMADAGNGYMQLWTATSHPIAFNIAFSEKMRLDASGRLGLGTSSPDALLTVNGVGAHGLGSAAAPSFAFTGDLNTGIYSPGADQVAISTNGTGRLFVDASGRVLAGTDTAIPQGANVGFGRLQVLGTGSTQELLGRFSADASAAVFAFLKSRNATIGSHTIVNSSDTLGQINFQGSDGTDYLNAALIRAEVDGTPGANDMPGRLMFFTAADGSASPTERMRLDSSGRLGLGSSAPQGLLHVEGVTGNAPVRIVGSSGNSSALALYNNAATTNRFVVGQGFSSGSDNVAFIQNDANAAMVFGTNAQERLRITSDGRLGLGTSSPGTLLDVVGGVGRIRTGGKAGSNTYLKLESTDASNSMELAFTQFTNNRWEIQATENGVSYRPLVLYPDGGNVGIGTTSPGAPLVVSAAGAAGMEVTPGSASASSGTLVEHYNRSTAAYVQVRTLAASHRFDIGGSEAARIDSSGRLLVGTSTGFGNSVFTKAEFVNSASYANIVVGRTDGASGSGSTIGAISFLSNAGGAGEYHASIAAEMDAASGSGDKPGRLVFSTTADGAASPTERVRITNDGYLRLAGKGVQFNGDTADANSLDDYEEGTWTPTQGAGLTLVGAYSSQGFYTKTGNTVVVFGSLFGATSIASSAAGILCGGLPFTPAPPTAGYVVGSMTNQAGNISNTCFSLNSTNAYGAVAVAANSGIHFTMTYRVA